MFRPNRTVPLLAPGAGLLARFRRADLLGKRVPLGPLACGLLVLCGAIGSLGTYAEHKAQLRLAETTRHVAQFETEPVAGAWRRLSRAWHAERKRQEALLQRIASREPGRMDGVLRRYREFVLTTVDQRGLAADIDTVLRFYQRLALCIRMGSCDREIAAAMLGDQARRFRNQHYPYLVDEYPDEPVDADLRLVSPPSAGPQQTARAPGASDGTS